MALQTSGPISLSDIQTEFGGSNPISLSEYYAGAASGYVPASTTGPNGAVPSSGAISFSDFYGVSKLVPGQAAFTTPGTYLWTAPAGVTSVCVVCVGGGGGGHGYSAYARGGAGGGLGWKNNIPVVPGQSYTVNVGTGGTRSTYTSSRTATAGGTSYFINTSTVAGYGGDPGGYNITGINGGTYVGDGGGNGGAGGYGYAYAGGGGGAGGYSGNGGDAYIATTTTYYGSGNPGSGGGGGGGGSGGTVDRAGGGGGVGILGEGASGAGGTGSSADVSVAASGGSGGANGGIFATTSYVDGGAYGGGGGGSDYTSSPYYHGNGGGGAVRIIWGPNRAFPSTNTADV